MKRRATKRIAVLMTLVILTCFCATGCTEADQVSANISQEADNFNVTRKLTVLNARTDTILLELTGTFALKNNSSRELEVIIETAEGKYQKDYVYLNDYTMYVVEDISGSDVDKYHYEIISFRSGDLKSHTMIKFAPAQIGGKDNENCSN